jgi:hypothetical protein
MSMATAAMRSNLSKPLAAAQQDGLAADALGVIAHALQLGDDLGHRVDEAQVGGHGDVAHDELHAQGVDHALQVVHARVAQDGRVGQLGVLGGQGADGVLQAAKGEVGHLAHAVADVVDVLLEFLFEVRAHAPFPPVGGRSRRGACGRRPASNAPVPAKQPARRPRLRIPSGSPGQPSWDPFSP